MFERVRRVEPGGTSWRIFLQTDSTDFHHQVHLFGPVARLRNGCGGRLCDLLATFESWSKLAAAHSLDDVGCLANGQRDDRQSGVARHRRREQAPVGDEKVRNFVALSPPVDDTVLRLRTHAAGPHIV